MPTKNFRAQPRRGQTFIRQNESEIEAVKSERLSLPWADRYVIVRKGTGQVLNDCQGYGFQTPEQAIAEWNRIHRAGVAAARQRIAEQNEAGRDHRIIQWLQKRPRLFREVKDLFVYANRAHLPVDARDISEVIEQNGLKDPPFTSEQFLELWERENLTKATRP